MRKNEQTRVCTARTTTRQATLFSSRHSAEHLRALEPFFHFVAAGVWTGTFPCNWDDGACTLDISLHFRFPLWSKSPVWRSFDFCRVSDFFCIVSLMRSKALARRPSLPQHNALGVEWGTTTWCCQELHVYFVSCSLRKWPKPSHAQIDPDWLEKRIMFCFLLHDLLHEMHHAPCTSIQSDILTTDKFHERSWLWRANHSQFCSEDVIDQLLSIHVDSLWTCHATDTHWSWSPRAFAEQDGAWIMVN